MFAVQWRNRVSGETGFVKKINRKEGYFENTWEGKDAKLFKTEKNAKVLLSDIEFFTNVPDNDYQVVEINGKLVHVEGK